jgi:hypothetical protein
MSILNCVQNEPFSIWMIAVVTVICGLVFGASILLTYCLCYQRASKPWRVLKAIKKRTSGMPKKGKMCVVVTDIEGYSGARARGA